MATWQSISAQYDGDVMNIPPTGNMQVDTPLRYLDSQLNYVKTITDLGFTKLESLVGKLDDFGDKLVSELAAVRNELKTNQFADQTIGSKMDIMINKMQQLRRQDRPDGTNGC